LYIDGPVKANAAPADVLLVWYNPMNLNWYITEGSTLKECPVTFTPTVLLVFVTVTVLFVFCTTKAPASAYDFDAISVNPELAVVEVTFLILADPLSASSRCRMYADVGSTVLQVTVQKGAELLCTVVPTGGPATALPDEMNTS
jgi:hypothetical protein